MVTGSTGWIGRAMLAAVARERGLGWQAGVRLFGSRAGDVVAADGNVLPVRPLETMTGADVDGALVVHLAYLTKEKAAALGERRFTDGNLAIDDRLLAALGDARPAGVFVASSGAAALAADGRDRHPYGLCKLRQEDRLLGWGAAAGVPVLAGRIWNVAGPYMTKVATYALGDMLVQARTTGRIRVAATVPVFRSFLHVDDLCTLVLRALEGGVVRAGPVDLCGAEVLEMADLAARVAARVGLAPDAIERGAVDLARPSVYLGHHPDTATLAMAVGHAVAGFDRQLADTDDWLRTTAAS